MTSKFNYYDILGVLVPGVLFSAWIPICFPDLAEITANWPFPEAFTVIVLTALAVFLGQIIQALGSIMEHALFKTWGGRPSDLTLSGELPSYLPSDSATRIKKKLEQAAGRDSSVHSLFLFAMQRADGMDAARARLFNSL